jgi:hypothetical protein
VGAVTAVIAAAVIVVTRHDHAARMVLAVAAWAL